MFSPAVVEDHRSSANVERMKKKTRLKHSGMKREWTYESLTLIHISIHYRFVMKSQNDRPPVKLVVPKVVRALRALLSQRPFPLITSQLTASSTSLNVHADTSLSSSKTRCDCCTAFFPMWLVSFSTSFSRRTFLRCSFSWD